MQEVVDFVEDTFDDGGIAAFRNSRNLRERGAKFDADTSTQKDSILLKIAKNDALMRDQSDGSIQKMPDLLVKRDSLKLSDGINE